MPRPNSRVEIVTAMRRIRVSVVRMLLPHRGGGSTSPASPLTTFSHISPVLQVIPNSAFFTVPLSIDICTTQAWCMQIPCVTPSPLEHPWLWLCPLVPVHPACCGWGWLQPEH